MFNRVAMLARGLQKIVISLFLRLWNKILSILLWKIPATRYERWGFYTQAVLLVSFWSLMELCPAFTGHSVFVGYAIAALALAAVVMTARADALTSTEKIIWIAICAVMFIWELNVIDREHAEQEHQHLADLREQQQEFNATMTRFSETENLTRTNLNKTQQAANTATEAVNMITGGKGFCYIELGSVSIYGKKVDQVSPVPSSKGQPSLTRGSDPRCGRAVVQV